MDGRIELTFPEVHSCHGFLLAGDWVHEKRPQTVNIDLNDFLDGSIETSDNAEENSRSPVVQVCPMEKWVSWGRVQLKLLRRSYCLKRIDLKLWPMFSAISLRAQIQTILVGEGFHIPGGVSGPPSKSDGLGSAALARGRCSR